MKFEFTLDADDYLVHQLYVASVTPRIQKSRKLRKWVVPAFYLVFAAYLYIDGGDITGVFIFAALTLLWFAFYPSYQKRHYKNHYKKFINDTYAERFGRPNTLELQPEFILAKDDGSDGKTKITEVKQVVDLPAHYLIQIKGGQYFILPSKVVESPSEFSAYFTDKNIAIVNEQSWEWK